MAFRREPWLGQSEVALVASRVFRSRTRGSAMGLVRAAQAPGSMVLPHAVAFNHAFC